MLPSDYYGLNKKHPDGVDNTSEKTILAGVEGSELTKITEKTRLVA